MSYYSVTFVNQENEQQYSDTLTPSPPPPLNTQDVWPITLSTILS